MVKAPIIYLAVCSLTNAAYIGRMSAVNRVRSPTPFRPGIMLQRPWIQTQTRLVHAASNRSPYILYRNPPRRYVVKHYNPAATRNMFGVGPWKATGRLPPLTPSTSEYEFMKAASTSPVAHSTGGTGAIHTIPAPNLSLAEKPIVVIDASDSPVSQQPKPSYEVTEKYQEPELSIAKIQMPIGFSKATSLTTPELQTLMRNGAALQIATEFGLPINVQQPHVVQSQLFPTQTFNALPTQQDFVNSGAEGIFIPPNALLHSDPMFMQKLQSQLLQQFPAVEFIPYPADARSQIQNQVHLQSQASQNYPQVIVVDEQIKKQIPEQKNVVQRETQESIVTLIPQSFIIPNVTQANIDETTTKLQSNNITLDEVTTEPLLPTTVKKVTESNTEHSTEQNTTPIYYAQIGQSVGSVIANGFYSALNDVRAAVALAQSENPREIVAETENGTATTTAKPDIKSFLIKKYDKSDNQTNIMPLAGAPFRKPEESENIAYRLLRTDDKKPEITQEGAVYAGQIVEATVTEDHDFNKEKANLLSRRAPIRLFANVDTKDSNISSATNSIPEVTVIKAKISPKTKLTFDDKTGEPILRIYASYMDNPEQKEAVLAKLATLKHIKDESKNPLKIWKAGTVKSMANAEENIEENTVTQFGLKLRSRSDDYIPLFEDYDE